MKYLTYNEKWVNSYFWRTKQKQEIDYVEESNGKLLACEIKWNAKTKAKLPKTFSENYTNSDFIVVTPDTVDDFLL